MIKPHSLFTAAIVLTSVPSFAQSEFQLPRECSERQVADPQKCVIQDGLPPRLPWVRPVPVESGAASGITAPASPMSAPAQPPAFRKAIRR